jgi:putative oxidoreductase
MKYVIIILRYLLASLMLVAGSNKLIPYIPTPPLTGDIAVAMAGFMATKYLLPLIGLVEVLAAVSLFTGFFLPLMLVVLAPITFNILLFHLFVATEGIPMGIFVFVVNFFLLWTYRALFEGVLRLK